MCNASTASNSRSSCPPHFSGVRTIINHSSVLPHFPRFGKGKTMSIHCHFSANFFGPSGFDRARAHLYPGSYSSSLKCSALIACWREKQWYADTMPAICSAQILPQYTSIVPCIQIDVKVWNFPPVYQNFCLFFWKSVALICATSALNSRVYVWYISCRETYHLTELERSAIGAGCKMPQGTPGRKGSSSVIFFSRSSCKRAYKSCLPAPS